MTTNTHPYRKNDLQVLCVICRAPAHFLCPRCRRPFCIEHATASSCCADCELTLARGARRWTMGMMTGYLAAAGSATCYLALSSCALGIVTGGFSVLGGIFVTAVARRLARGRTRSWEPVEGVELRVGADGGQERPARRLGWLFRGGGKKDMYQQAYDAGFNRVQGCA